MLTWDILAFGSIWPVKNLLSFWKTLYYHVSVKNMPHWKAFQLSTTKVELLLSNLAFILRSKKLLWDFKIQSDHHIEHNKPDIVRLNKDENSCIKIDVAHPFDTRIASKEREKMNNYCNLKHETKRIWKCRSVQVIPIVIGALGTVSKGFEMRLRQLGMRYCMELLQWISLLGSVWILQKVLDT